MYSAGSVAATTPNTNRRRAINLVAVRSFCLRGWPDLRPYRRRRALSPRRARQGRSSSCQGTLQGPPAPNQPAPMHRRRRGPRRRCRVLVEILRRRSGGLAAGGTREPAGAGSPSRLPLENLRGCLPSPHVRFVLGSGIAASAAGLLAAAEVRADSVPPALTPREFHAGSTPTGSARRRCPPHLEKAEAKIDPRSRPHRFLASGAVAQAISRLGRSCICLIFPPSPHSSQPSGLLFLVLHPTSPYCCPLFPPSGLPYRFLSLGADSAAMRRPLNVSCAKRSGSPALATTAAPRSRAPPDQPCTFSRHRDFGLSRPTSRIDALPAIRHRHRRRARTLAPPARPSASVTPRASPARAMTCRSSESRSGECSVRP